MHEELDRLALIDRSAGLPKRDRCRVHIRLLHCKQRRFLVPGVVEVGTPCLTLHEVGCFQLGIKDTSGFVRKLLAPGMKASALPLSAAVPAKR